MSNSLPELPGTVVGIGGSLRDGSRTEQILRIALEAAEKAGAKTTMITGTDLVLPFYDATTKSRPVKAHKLIEAVRNADGILVISPGYHGALSGLVKNALDYVEDLRDDVRPYFSGRAVGTIAVAQGWQAAVTTLEQLRTIAHALRGWPTPLGVATTFRGTGAGDEAGAEDRLPVDRQTAEKLRIMGRQVAEFARASHRV